MPTDPEYLRRHYASLSDEALLDIDRKELVESAQKCYDDELVQRSLPPQRGRVAETTSLEDKPAWADEANEVFSQVSHPGAVPAPEIANARDALEAAGIPCYLDLSDQQEDPPDPRPTKIWRLMVPGNLNQRATSILERDIFNAEFEAEWKTHLEMLSDDDLRAMDPKLAFCGLFDRVERVTRAFDEELARRQSKSTAPWFS
jgi:hypothetical protein